MEIESRGVRPRGASPPPASSPKRRCISRELSAECPTAESMRHFSPAWEEPSGAPPATAVSVHHEEAPLPFSHVQQYRLSCNTFLLQLLHHVLRQRLRAALRGQLHKISVKAPPGAPGAPDVPGAPGPPSKRPAFEPSPAVESLLRGEGPAAAALRERSSSSSSSSSSNSSKGAPLETVAGSLAAKLACCLQLKEKSSVLVLGPRGSGATTAVESALRYVQQQQQQHVQQQQQHVQQQQQQQQLLVVRVNCSLYPNDAAILQAIVRRLCAALQQQQQKQQQHFGGTFNDWLLRLKDILTASCSLLGSAVVIVLDRVEVCCLSGASRGPGGSGQQQLLYNLFDLQHGHGLHICSVCLSPVLDLTDFMEKRIRSRFTMQRLCLSSAVRTPQLISFIQNKLLRVKPEELLRACEHTEKNAHTEKDKILTETFLKAFDAAVETNFNDKQFLVRCDRALSLGRDARSFLVSAVSPLLRLHPRLPRFGASGASWGAPEAPEALSPLHSPLRNNDELSRHPSPQRMRLPTDETKQQQQEQQQQQQQQGEGLQLCEEAVSSLRAGDGELEEFSSLSFSEHLILTAFARLHRRRLLPKTFFSALEEISGFFKLHTAMRRRVSQPGLRRAFARLHEARLLQRCAYSLQHLGLTGVVGDFHGSHQPCKFPSHERYAEAIVSLPVPSDLSVWLRSHSFNT